MGGVIFSPPLLYLGGSLGSWQHTLSKVLGQTASTRCHFAAAETRFCGDEFDALDGANFQEMSPPPSPFTYGYFPERLRGRHLDGAQRGCPLTRCAGHKYRPGYRLLHVKDLLPVGWMAAVAVQTKLHLLGPFVLTHTRMHTPTQTHTMTLSVCWKRKRLFCLVVKWGWGRGLVGHC